MSDSAREGTEPVRGQRVLSGVTPRAEDLTSAQVRRLEQRAKERRRITEQALRLRFDAVWAAHEHAKKTGDRQPLVGELENVASACMAWARYIRSTHQL